jgi:basic membrane protein A
MKIVAAVGLLALAGLGCCQPAPLAPMRLAALFSGPVNDAGWNASAFRYLIHLQATGFKIARTESVKQPDQQQVLRDYAKAGFDVVLAHGFEFTDAIRAVAPAFPRTHFLQIAGSLPDLPNVYTLNFTAGEGGYFMGFLAAHLSRTHRVAVIAGTNFAALTHDISMMRRAAATVPAPLEVIESYIGNWSGDVARAKELASAAIEQGVDILIPLADAADMGTIQAAREAVLAGKRVWVLSWVHDQHALAPDFILGGWEMKVPVLIEEGLRRLQARALGGHFAGGLAEGATAVNPCYGLVPAALEAKLRQMVEKYKKDPRSFPNLEVRRDL